MKQTLSSFVGLHNFVVLNIYPYISGHPLIVPYEHVGNLDAAAKQTTDELMDLTKRCQTALRDVYQPAGFNVGMNLGRAAGAGIVDHIHIHILPRWEGDTNFMTTVGETRVIPEDLGDHLPKAACQILRAQELEIVRVVWTLFRVAKASDAADFKISQPCG